MQLGLMISNVAIKGRNNMLSCFASIIPRGGGDLGFQVVGMIECHFWGFEFWQVFFDLSRDFFGYC